MCEAVHLQPMGQGLHRSANSSSAGPVEAQSKPQALPAEPDGLTSFASGGKSSALGALPQWLTPGRQKVGLEVAGWLMVCGVLAWLQGGAALANLKYTLQPYRLNGDAQQQIYPFYRYLEPNAFGGDYIAEYYLSSYPLGYKSLYLVGTWFDVDPAALSRSLPHLLWLCTVLALGAAVRALGGKLAAFVAMALALGSNAYLDRIQGGLPRSFGFPIVAIALAGLAYARVGVCIAAVWLGALFYPVAGLLSGLSLGGLLLLPERTGFSVSGYSWRRRLYTLGGTALVAVALLLPSAIGTSRYGKVVRPSDVTQYPEAGPGGRYSSESRAPFRGFFESVPRPAEAALFGAAEPWSPSARAWLLGSKKPAQRWSSERYRQAIGAIFLLALAGAVALLVRQAAARRVALLGVAAGVGYGVSRIVVPYAYLPERYVAYAVPLLATVIVSTGVAGFFGASFAQGRRRWAKWATLSLAGALVLALLAGRVAGNVGLTHNLRHDSALYDAIAKLPPNSMVAGWPRGLMNAVAYASRRPTLISMEVHQAFHAGYVEEMRRRMYALIDAYFATSAEPILRLGREFGVTHLLIQRSHYGRNGPGYFRPFGAPIKAARDAGHKRYLLPKLASRASIFQRGDYMLLDLAKIEAASVVGGASPGR